MSKKETEFDRYDRMKKIKFEAEIEKRKEKDSFRKPKKEKINSTKKVKINLYDDFDDACLDY